MVIGAEAVAVDPTVILHITVGHMEFFPIREKTAGPQQMPTKSTQYCVTRCQAVKETAPESLGQYLLVKPMYNNLNNLIHMNYYVALL